MLIFSTALYLKPIQADNENSIVIQNIQTLPTTIIIGQTFKINATLANNSPNPIFVEHGSCEAPFSVTFDNHVVIRTNNVTCTLQLIEQRLDPGTKITSTNPNLDLTYVAAENGTVNATVSFPYNVWNQTSQSNIKENISKPFSFMIYPTTRVPALSPHDNQAIIDVALAIPGLQKWSNDWQYVSMGFMTGKNQPGNWQYATVNLKASSNSSLIPCDNNNDWWAWVMIDRTTMKVIQATYPTMESHNCNYATGGGPSTYGNTIPAIDTPLKQFKSGIAAKDVKCRYGLELIFKFEDSSPVCVTKQTAQTLVERWWGMYVPAVTEHIPILSNSIKVQNTDLTINYNISGNNKLVDANADVNSKSLTLSLKTTNNGTLTVSIPRTLVDARIGQQQDDKFYVLMDGQEVNYTEINTTNTTRTLSIPFTNSIEKIEIIGTNPI